MKLFYPHKTPSQLEELLASAKRDLHHLDQPIDFRLLFVEDDEGRFGAFLSTLVEQIRQERSAYVERIKQVLIGYPLITVAQFRRAVHMVDPKIDGSELRRYIEWVFSVDDYQSSTQIKPMDVEDLLRRLENCACFEHEKRSKYETAV